MVQVSFCLFYPLYECVCSYVSECMFGSSKILDIKHNNNGYFLVLFLQREHSHFI